MLKVLMSDTKSYRNDLHMFTCGTCKYKKKGRCHNFIADCFSEIVDDDCSCTDYVPKRGT